jgi:hypothetical protein
MRVLRLYEALDGGHIEPVAGLLENFFPVGEPIAFEAMPLAMDIASGISDERLALVQEQARTSLLGLYLNFPMPQLRGALGLDLGGRTYPDEQAAAVAGLSELTHVMVVNAGHNLFMVSPEVTEVIQQFMRGEEIGAREIVAPPPELPGPPD